MIVDTSAWIEFLRATGSPHDQAVAEATRSGSLMVPDVVRLELLAGAGGRVEDLRRLLAAFTPVATSSPLDHDVAADLYRSARAAGRTVRSLMDCLVAAIALRLDVPVLARDRDFEELAAVSDLRVAAV